MTSTSQIEARARAVADAGGVSEARAAGTLAPRLDIRLSEATVLGLLLQDVRSFLVVLGHGSTELGEILRIYADAGAVSVYPVRHETEAAHAATALRWVTGEKAAVVTSIGPGALHAFAGALVSASDGIGVWHIYGDETTEAEGPNMQQLPRATQEGYLQLCSTMGRAYTLHTPAALPTALRWGSATVDDPHRGGPFFLLMPLNTQPQIIENFNLDELPDSAPPALGAAADDSAMVQAARVLLAADRVVVKVGGGARHAGRQIERLLELVDGVAVTSPLVSGVIPYDNPRVMGVGGSKGSISGNYAMEHADALLAIGTRAVCQSDSSRTGYPQVRHVVNVNIDIDDAIHYGNTMALRGDAGVTLDGLIAAIGIADTSGGDKPGVVSQWLADCSDAKREWAAFKSERYDNPCLFDPERKEELLTQPAAIKTITDAAKARGAVTFFDAGDPQANGFQIVEDDRPGRTITETGASYMGFGVSALLATAISRTPFYGVAVTGDGSFTMNPQVLIDGVAHGATGCIALLDNRRMAAISSLQRAQYGHEFATWDHVEVDYLGWARSISGVEAIDGGTSIESLDSALDQAFAHDGLSLVYIPVYYGEHPLGGLGAFGRWNVGSQVDDTQTLRHEIGL